LYRDLKAENVLLGEDGYIILTDFGLAKRLRSKKEETSTFCGTPEYMSPEILGKMFGRPQKHGLSIDWWAIGVLTYEMICGRTPFYDKDRKEMYKNICKKAPYFPEKNHPDIKMSPLCRDFLSRCLDKNPETRIGY